LALARRHYAAIGALAATTIFCETALTRLFSVVQYYHGAFLAISVALFGFAVSGVFVLLRGEGLARERLDGALARHALLFSLAIPVSFYAYLYVGVAELLRGIGVPAFLAVACEYALLTLPFFASGVCISLLLLHGAREANRLYAADLASSALGAVAVIPALAWFGGPKSMLVASAVAALVAVAFARAARGVRWLAPSAAFGALAALALVPAERFEQMQLRKPAAVVASEAIRWNAFSMVGVGAEEMRPFRRRQIVIDNSVTTVMLPFDGDLSKVSFLKSDYTAAAYQLRLAPRVLIIGSGGGRDILTALAHDATHVRAVEVNPLVFETSAHLFGEFTGRVYLDPRVTPVVGDARSYIANSHEQFDVVLASLIDTWAASSAGAFALTENLLYTTDAFRDYHQHLTPDGILSVSRWHPFETPRLLATAFAAWREAGAADPRRHALLIRTPERPGLKEQASTLLMKKSPFTPEEIRTIERFCSEARLLIALAPDRISDTVVSDFFQGAEHADGAWSGVDWSPASDERPFFFNMVRPSTQLLRMVGVGAAGEFEENAFQGNLAATRSLIHLLGAVVLLLVATIGVPLLVRGGDVRGPGWPWILGYFACLGLGYIVIQIGLLQRLILLLGKPVYALAVILSTMLLASGCGSFVAGTLAPNRLRARLSALLGGATVLLVAYAFFLPALITALLGSAFGVRLAGSVALVALPGFLLGMPFPSGIRALEGLGRRGLVPWVWGLNGAMSVMASVSAIILAIELGYTAVFLLGAACYGLAAVLLLRWPFSDAPLPAAARR
jgi:spermidine synthase